MPAILSSPDFKRRMISRPASAVMEIGTMLFKPRMPLRLARLGDAAASKRWREQRGATLCSWDPRDRKPPSLCCLCSMQQRQEEEQLRGKRSSLPVLLRTEAVAAH